jgi:hypothetical protein
MGSKINTSPSFKNTEAFEDRNVTSAVCRSTPNGLNDLSSQIDKCITTTELNRNKSIGDISTNLKSDIDSLSSMVADSLSVGDSMFGKLGHSDISGQTNERNTELKMKKEKLLKKIDKNEAIIERSNRDFTDVKAQLPEKQPNKVLHFIEDYTLAILSISYIFMVLSYIYLHTIQSEVKITGFLKASGWSIVATVFSLILLYYFS